MINKLKRVFRMCQGTFNSVEQLTLSKSHLRNRSLLKLKSNSFRYELT